MLQLDFYAILLTLVILYRYLTTRNSLPRPPGPPGYPVIGNLLDMPSKNSYLTFTEWAKKYSRQWMTSARPHQ